MKKLLQKISFGIVMFALPLGSATAVDIVLTSWGGAYTFSQQKAFSEPWMKKTGNKIIDITYSGGNAEVRTQVESGNIKWDIVDNVPADVKAGCEEGLFEKVDYSKRLAKGKDGSKPTDDFLITDECFIPLIVYSTVAAYNKDLFPGEKPKTAADFFNLKKFPGKRALRKKAQFTLEYALIADGVPAAKIYDVLDTKAGVNRAFAKLDTIKDSVVWWTSGAQGPQLLADKEVAISSSFNGRFFSAQVVDNQPFEIMWDGQLLEFDGLAIVKGALKNKAKADAIWDFVKFASDTQRLADQAKYISYGPARKSSDPYVTNHYKTGVAMAPHMPTSKANLTNAVVNNDEFWADNSDALNERFNTWLAK